MQQTTGYRLLTALQVKTTEAVCVPWTSPQIANLNRWQRNRPAYAFRCPNHKEALIAHHDGWMCPAKLCAVRLKWALPNMICDNPKETKAEKRALMLAWNERYPNTGASVKMEDEKGNVIKTRTKSRAFISKGKPMVRVEHMKDPVSLEDVFL